MEFHLYTTRKKTGFSLVEVVLSTAILALVLTVSMEIVRVGNSAGPKSQDSLTAYSLARGTIEDYSLWSNCSSNGTFTPAPNPITLNNKSYSQNVVIADGPIVGHESELKSITVTVTVTEGLVIRNYTLTTLKADY